MTSHAFSQPINDRYLEDYVIGNVYEFGTAAIDEREIIAFASQYDPQVFHTDPQGAKHTIFGGVIASGWHTAGLMMRMYCDHYLSRIASLGSPGIDELRWPNPVRPGDHLSLRVTVLDSRPSRSKPDRGILVSFIEVLNQTGAVVMSMKAVNMLLRRPA